MRDLLAKRMIDAVRPSHSPNPSARPSAHPNPSPKPSPSPNPDQARQYADATEQMAHGHLSLRFEPAELPPSAAGLIAEVTPTLT